MLTTRVKSLVATTAALAVAWVLAKAFLPHGLPFGVIVLGLAFGLLNSLGAVGLILVYRAGGYINFAQSSFGAAGSVLAYRLTTAYNWPWAFAILTGLAVAIALAILSEILFVQRLFTAPRLILTVATIGIAQFVAVFEILFGRLRQTAFGAIAAKLSPPFNVQFTIGLIRFTSSDVLVYAVVPVVLVAVGVFLTRSRYGAVVQAAAENSGRARLLGVSVRSLSTMTWALVGALSAVAALLETPLIGTTIGGATTGPSLLLRALAPAMIAGLRNMPLAVGAALVLGVVEETVSFSVNQAGPVDLILFGIILVAMLLRRRGQSRTTEGEERSFAISSVVRPIPRQLVRLPAVRAWRLGGLAVAVAVAVAIPFGLQISGQSLATAVLCYILAALSLTVLTGYAGQISFGQWAFVGFGSLFGAAMVESYHLPFLAGLIVTSLAGAGVAVVVGLPALRIRGIFLGVTTLAFAVAANSYIFNLHFFSAAGYVTRTTVLGLDLGSQRTYYWFCLAALGLCMLGVRNLRGSVLGRQLVAVRDNDRAAGSYGVGAARARLWAFAISGFLAALAGYLYLFNEGTANSETFSPLVSLLLFSGVVIGGLTTQLGAVIGMLWFKGIQYFLPEWAQFFATSFGVLLVLLFVPGGLSTIAFGARDRLLGRYAAARGVRVGALSALRREHAETGAQAIATAAAHTEREAPAVAPAADRAREATS